MTSSSSTSASATASSVSATPNSTSVAPVPAAYLLLHNVGKKQNFGQLIRSAMAFGVAEVGVVGAKKLQDLSLFGNQGTSGHVNFKFFDALDEAVAYFKGKQEHKNENENGGVDICGIEISADSRPVCAVEKRANLDNGDGTASVKYAFRRSTVFMLGNEGTGLSEKQLAVCDYLTYIPQYSGAT